MKCVCVIKTMHIFLHWLILSVLQLRLKNHNPREEQSSWFLNQDVSITLCYRIKQTNIVTYLLKSYILYEYGASGVQQKAELQCTRSGLEDFFPLHMMEVSWVFTTGSTSGLFHNARVVLSPRLPADMGYSDFHTATVNDCERFILKWNNNTLQLHVLFITTPPGGERRVGFHWKTMSVKNNR